MGQYIAAVTEFFGSIQAQAEAEPNPHRKAILENYLVHAALEYTERWPEIFDAHRTVEHPIYKVRWGTDDVVVYDGLEQVQSFYRSLKDDKLLTNQDQILAVNDWGFSAFLTINLFMTGDKLATLGQVVDAPDGHYVLATPCAMYWTYDEKARLIGEYVYEIGAGRISKVAPQDVITYDDVQRIVEPYLPSPPPR